MYQIDFNKPQAIHFIGIGGISMSGLAEILLQEGFRVSGSDAQKSGLTEHLEQKGAKIFIGQRASNIEDGTEVVVYTARIHEDNPEFMEAKHRQLPMLSRAELLGEMMRNYHQAVAIAGTHGKTHNHVHADRNPFKGPGGSYHFSRRNAGFHSGKYPDWKFRSVCNRSL